MSDFRKALMITAIPIVALSCEGNVVVGTGSALI